MTTTSLLQGVHERGFGPRAEPSGDDGRGDRPTPNRSNDMPLQDQLDAFKRDFEAKAPKDKLAVMARVMDDLRRSGQLSRALKVGDLLPPFALPNQRGETVASADLLARGPLVVTVFRGAWCPFCMIELEALNAALPEIRARGAGFVAITPQTPDRSAEMAAQRGLAFDVLSDAGLVWSDAAGIAYAMPPDLQAVYRGFGVDLAASNGDASWRLPMPARLVVDRGGRIVDARIDPDYTVRPDPSETVAALDRAAAAAGAR